MGERRCYFCRRNGSADPLERHHVFGGNHADRKKSEKYGAVVDLCGNACHRNGEHAVHRDGDVMRRLRREFQSKATASGDTITFAPSCMASGATLTLA